MASCFYLLKQFDDVLVFLQVGRVFLPCKLRLPIYDGDWVGLPGECLVRVSYGS
jgi:hypothetical protein